MNIIDGNLFLGGAYGLLMKSAKGGNNWSEININTKSEIRIITSDGTDTGLLYSGDSSLYRTLNGGLNWTQIKKFNFAVYDIAIPKHNTVYISASGRLGKSSNGGNNWIYFIPDSASVNNYFSYYFIDSIKGLLSAIDVNSNYAMIFKTTDSGTTWAKYNSTVDNFIIQKLYFINSFTGWAAGSRFGNLFLLKTSNGGINWSEQNTGQFEASVKGLYFRDSNEGFIATNLNILKTSNGGLNWIEYISDYGISSSCFPDDSIFYLSDMNGRLIKVNNAGQADTIFGKKNFRLDNIFAASGNNIWISGGGYRNFRSTNGGQSWYYDFNSYSLQLKNIFFVNSNTGFALAGRGKIMATSDFGNNWELIYDTNEEFSNIYFLNAYTGWVSGIGSIRKTVNGGFNWMTSSLNGDIIKMWFSDSNIGYAIMN
ncbi:MAG: hypothetical protein MUE56_09385, partial [Ignavibacteria bacterium]|nr:hypothetical protein [Ignavibacteria bacterium]